MINKPTRFSTLVAVTAATLVVRSATTALSQQRPTDLPKGKAHSKDLPEHHQDMMDMSALMQEPHHVLAVAYRNNMVIFAAALHQQATADSTINPTFARAAVAEMKRSFDQMLFHHKDHVKSVPAAMQVQMAAALAAQDMQNLALQSDLTALDKEVKTGTLDSKTILKLVGDILERCDGKASLKTAAKDAAYH